MGFLVGILRGGEGGRYPDVLRLQREWSIWVFAL